MNSQGFFDSASNRLCCVCTIPDGPAIKAGLIFVHAADGNRLGPHRMFVELAERLKNRGIARGQIALDDLFKPPLSILNAAELGVELFGETGLKEIIEDLNESIFLKEAA